MHVDLHKKALPLNFTHCHGLALSVMGNILNKTHKTKTKTKNLNETD